MVLFFQKINTLELHMKVVVRWKGDVAFEGETESGHTVLMDGPPDAGGKNQGPRPMEMLLLGMGACSSVDVISILKKSRQPVSNCRVEIKSSRAPEPPRVFTEIHLHFVVTGNKLNEKNVQRAISLSAEKYCSASIMLGAMARVTHDYEIVAAA